MDTLSPSTAAGAFGSALGFLMASALLARRGAPPASRLLAGLLLCGAIAGAAITWSHATHRGLATVVLVELVVTLLSGPLLLGAVRAHLEPGWHLRRRDLLHLAPAGALAALGSGALLARPALLPSLPVWPVLLCQAAYTLFAGRFLVRTRRGLPGRGVAATLVGGMVLVHLAQALRMALPGPALRDVVPAAIAMWIAAFTFLAARAWISAPAPGRRVDPGDAAAVVERLAACLEGQRLFLDPDLTVAQLAARAEVTPREASAALRADGSSFADFVNLRRIGEAKRLLGSSEHRHLTVDAIGGRAGFRSRSVFYTAFRRHAGASPAEYRTSGLRIQDRIGAERT